jgi:hypothetical protein
MTTLGIVQVQKWSLHWPKFGSWRADVLLAEGTEPTGKVTITCGTLELHGEVMRAWLDAADKPHAIVVGGLGWQSLILAPLSYQSDGGVQLRTVLRALSAAAGEPVELPRDLTIGEYYECVASRPGEPVRVADALDALVRDGYCPNWRIDPDGVTRFGAREPSTVSARATLMSKSASLGIATYGLDDPAQFAPGSSVEGEAIERLDLRESDGKLEIDVFSSESKSTPNIREMVRRMVAAELDDRKRTYVVVACHSDGRCDLTPPPDAPHLPELKNVQQWLIGGATFNAAAGDLAVVERREGRGSRPIITGFERVSGSDPTAFPGAASQGMLVSSGGILQAINFSDLAGATPLMLVTAGLTPIPGPYLVSFGIAPGPVPPTLLSSGPLFGAIYDGSRLVGIKTQ